MIRSSWSQSQNSHLRHQHTPAAPSTQRGPSAYLWPAFWKAPQRSCPVPGSNTGQKMHDMRRVQVAHTLPVLTKITRIFWHLTTLGDVLYVVILGHFHAYSFYMLLWLRKDWNDEGAICSCGTVDTEDKHWGDLDCIPIICWFHDLFAILFVSLFVRDHFAGLTTPLWRFPFVLDSCVYMCLCIPVLFWCKHVFGHVPCFRGFFLLHIFFRIGKSQDRLFGEINR